MRNKLVTIVSLLMLISLTELPFSGVPCSAETALAAPRPIVDWRRTRQGWERIRVTEPVPPPAWTALGAMHPLVLATLEIAVSLGALLGFASEREIVQALSRQSRTSTSFATN